MQLLIYFILILFQPVFSLASEECPAGEHRVKSHPRRAYIRSDGRYVSATYVSGSCRKNPKGYDFWKPKLSEKRPGNWPDANKKEKSKAWTTEEAERVLEALADVPEILWLDTIKSIHRMDKSIIKNNFASGTPGNLVLYDNAFNEKQNLTRILVHEFAHEYYRAKMNLSDQVEYNIQADWRLDESHLWAGVKRWKTSRSKFVEPDGSDSPEEDFANNLEYYFFNRTKLQFYSPGAYNWINMRLGDKIKKGSSR